SPSGELTGESLMFLNGRLATLRALWKEMGIPEELQRERTEAVKAHVKNLLDMMISEEENLKECLLNSITVCRRELDTLHRELRLDPFEVEEQGTILQMAKDLHAHMQALLKQKADRKQELKILQEQDQDLCKILCTARFLIDSDAMPSLEDLDLYRRHLDALSAEKERRQEEFASTKQQILLLVEELEHSPENSFEQDVVSSDEEDFCLSQHIAALQSLRQQLEAQRSLNAEVCMELRSRITELWERLQVPAEERELSAVH
ncbi:PRC1 regulator, partial [Thinocorus orbignyianus]|nr:PRC1 regulator [Thinocorus orbignyianus]